MKKYLALVASIESDEEKVDEIFENLDVDEDDDGEELDGLEVQAILSDLFVNTDRLARNARDASAVIAFADTAEKLQDIRQPFGFDRNSWSQLRTDSAKLHADLESGDPTDEQVLEQAAALAARLRPLV